MNTRERTIQDEIRDLTEEARRLDYEARRPRACPRAAWDAEERYRVILEKLADLRAKAELENIIPLQQP
jgi:hypothetical protein